VIGSGEKERRTSTTSMTLRRPPTADCRGGKAGDACSTICRIGMRTKVEGRYDLVNRPLNAPQNESSPQLVGTGDSEGIVVERVRDQTAGLRIANV